MSRDSVRTASTFTLSRRPSTVSRPAPLSDNSTLYQIWTLFPSWDLSPFRKADSAESSEPIIPTLESKRTHPLVEESEVKCNLLTPGQATRLPPFRSNGMGPRRILDSSHRAGGDARKERKGPVSRGMMSKVGP